jgi:GGDEF domain-containing protein
LDAVRTANLPSEAVQRPTASIGYALAPGDAVTTLELLRRADDAMYAAKKQGGDRALHCAAPAAD